MKLSNTLSASILTALLGAGNGSVNIGNGSHCWLGLSDRDPGDDGSLFREPSGMGYTRTDIAAVMNTRYKSAELEESAATLHYRRIGNADQISFHEALDPANPEAATGGDWGSISHWGLFTAKTGGTLYAWGELLNPVNIQTHNVFLFRDGEFEISLEETAANTI